MDNGSTREVSKGMDNSSEIGKELDKAGEVVKALQLYDSYGPPVNLLYKEFIGKTHIEKHEQEDFVVEKIVRGVNFYKTKAKNIILCAKEIVKKHNGKIPRDFDKNNY